MDLNSWNFQNEISLISGFITTGASSQKNVIRSRGRDHISDLISQVIIELFEMGFTTKYLPKPKSPLMG